MRWRAALLLAGQLSIKALDDWAVDREAGTPEGFTIWPCDQTVLYEGENLELLPQLSAEPLVDRVLGPFEQLRIPVGTVSKIEGGNSPHHIIRSESIGQICGQTLPQWIVAASRFRSIGADEDTFDRTGEAVVVA